MTKIRWTESEIKQVEQRLKEMILTKVRPRGDWTAILSLAQRVLDPQRRRASNSLIPNIWVSEPHGLLRTNTTYNIVANVVSELKLHGWPQSGRPHYNLPSYSWAVGSLHSPVSPVDTTTKTKDIELQVSPPFEGVVPESKPIQTNLELMPKSDFDRRLKALELNLHAQTLENRTLHMGLAHVADRLKELNAQVNDILAFVTSHGFPNKNV